MNTIVLNTVVLKAIRLMTIVLKSMLMNTIVLNIIRQKAIVLKTIVLKTIVDLQIIMLLNPLGFVMMLRTNSPKTMTFMEDFANYVEVRELHFAHVDVPNHVPGGVEGDHFLARYCTQPPFLA